MNILPFVFFKCLFHPGLLLTDIRNRHGGELSLLAAGISLTTAVLAGYLVFPATPRPDAWLPHSLLTVLLAAAAAAVYFPVVHLFAERHMPGSRISDLLAYLGFSLSPLLLTLPAALIFVLAGLPPAYFTALLTVLVVFVFYRAAAGVQENYQLKTFGHALLLLLSPAIAAVILSLLLLLAVAVFYL